MSTDVGTPFEPDPDSSPDAGTRLLSPISYALQRGFLLRRENPAYRYWAPIAAVTCGYKMVLFLRAMGTTLYMRSTECPSSLLCDYHCSTACL